MSQNEKWYQLKLFIVPTLIGSCLTVGFFAVIAKYPNNPIIRLREPVKPVPFGSAALNEPIEPVPFGSAALNEPVEPVPFGSTTVNEPVEPVPFGSAATNEQLNNSDEESFEQPSSSSSFNFPKASCGDKPTGGNDTWYPVFVDGGDLETIRSQFCADAVSTVREDSQVESVQLASFTNYDKAVKFAQAVGGDVGKPTSRNSTDSEILESEGTID